LLTEKEIKDITELSLSASKAILRIYNSDNFNVKIKSDNSPLTEADKASHKIISEGLLKLFPQIPILSEEGKETPYEERKSWDKFWLVDPLDGTKEFIKKNGEFTVNIALIEKQIPVFGIITVPVTGEIYYGGKEYGSRKNNRNITVSNKSADDELSVVQSRSHSGEEENRFYSNFEIKERLSKGSSLKICLIAEGKAELYFRGGPTWEWDTAAGHAILLGAGGYFVNKDKSELVYNKEIIKNFGFIASSFILE